MTTKTIPESARAQLNEYRLRDLVKLEELQATLADLGFSESRIIQDTNHDIMRLLIKVSGNEYEVRTFWKSEIALYRYPFLHFLALSPSTISDTRKKNQGNLNKVFKPTTAKIQELIDIEDATNTELAALNAAATNKVSAFLADIDAMEKEGCKVSYQRERTNNQQWSDKPNGAITGGEITHNGIEFSFTISNDGYISKKLSITYAVDNSLESFMALAENQYRSIE